MGSVIRPPAFARPVTQAPPVPVPARRRIDGRCVALVVAMIGLTWLFALAGAAFAVRAVLVICFAELAGRYRQSGQYKPFSQRNRGD